MSTTPTGIPGKKGTIGGASVERVVFEAEKAASNATIGHEVATDPHPQYTTLAETTALIPRFSYYFKWGMA